jgi:hypothetical protein
MSSLWGKERGGAAKVTRGPEIFRRSAGSGPCGCHYRRRAGRRKGKRPEKLSRTHGATAARMVGRAVTRRDPVLLGELDAGRFRSVSTGLFLRNGEIVPGHLALPGGYHSLGACDVLHGCGLGRH